MPTQPDLRVVLPVLTLAIGLLGAGCGGGDGPSPATAPAAADDRPGSRPVLPTVEGEVLREGISYGPFRAGQRPGGPDPSDEEILEDLDILTEHWEMIRVYGSDPATASILRLIDANAVPLKVMLGAWINPESTRTEDGGPGEPIPENARQNREQVSEAIRLANAYPEIVFAVNVGNETQVFWSGHRTAQDVLVGYLREVRAAIRQPVTTADDYNFWNKPESRAVAEEVDFIVLHAYAMWNRQTLEDSVPWTAQIVEGIVADHPNRTVVIGETGWATVKNPDAGGDEASQIIAEADEESQVHFYEGFTRWAREAGVAYFYFEAFDEPWKGGSDPRGVEKHWGLYDVDRQPKRAMASR